MATHAERVAAIKEHFERERSEWSIDELASEIARMPRSFCGWPDGTKEQWREAIFQNVNEGYLKLVGATHVRRSAPTPAEKKQDAKLTQGSFNFDEGE